MTKNYAVTIDFGDTTPLAPGEAGRGNVDVEVVMDYAVEHDPIWESEKSNYYTKSEVDSLINTGGSGAPALLRAGNDFTTFTEKVTADLNDILLIEDSAAAFIKKKINIDRIVSVVTSHVYSLFIDSEVPLGNVNGINTSFATHNDFDELSLKVYVNGIRLRAGALNDYIVTGQNTFNMLLVPQSDDAIFCDYRKKIN